jgi:hypothetical protein
MQINNQMRLLPSLSPASIFSGEWSIEQGERTFGST